MEALPEVDWIKAESHLKTCIECYQELVGQPDVNPWFGIGLLVGYQMRLEKGERTLDLYEAIMDFEL